MKKFKVIKVWEVKSKTEKEALELTKRTKYTRMIIQELYSNKCKEVKK